MADENGSKTCFVVMGFGEGTDYQSSPQRVLDLDSTYKSFIEPSVTALGLKCVRSDEIIHSSVIDKLMFEYLLRAELVIADLSTANANAIYELGVRHALRPHRTIVIAEEQFKFPFDLNHLNIERYQHLGVDIGNRETIRMRDILKQKMKLALASAETDSPVFIFLPQLLKQDQRIDTMPALAGPGEQKADQSFSTLMEDFYLLKSQVGSRGDWRDVVNLLSRLQKLQPTDPYITRQLALATYRSEYPDKLASFIEARSVLETLRPDTSSDAETVGVWGRVHEGLWKVTKEPDYLDKAIRSFARGYFMKDDFFNGIKFAFLLNVRATLLMGDESIADRVLASRIRTEVLALCEKALAGMAAKQDEWLPSKRRPNIKFWVQATEAEALLGLGRVEEAAALRRDALGVTPSGARWMVLDVNSQLDDLAALCGWTAWVPSSPTGRDEGRQVQE